MTAAVDLNAAARGLVQRWEHRPGLFFEEALCVTPWSKQVEAAESIDRHERTAVRSGQKIGKSAVCAWIALWWAFTRAEGRVVLTAPTEHQVKNILWPEVRRAAMPFSQAQNASRLARGLPAKARLIEPDWLALDPRTGLRLPGERGVFCVTTNEPEKMSGLSGKNLLCIVDEGSGYPDALWEAIFGNMAGGGRLLTTGNPTQTSGPFFEAFHERSEFWSTIHISSLDSPNVRAGREVIPGLATREWCEDRKREWGPESAAYRVRVLGEFPLQGATSIVSLSEYEAACKRWDSRPALDGDLDLGVDVARFGDDDSTIFARFGVVAWLESRVSGFDGNQVAAEVARVIRKLRVAGRRVRVKIDEIGYGASVVDRLRVMNEAGELGPAVTVSGINVAMKADNEDEYHLLRDQLWFGVAEWIRTACLLHDPKLKAELLGAQYGFDARGRRQVEPKDKMKKRIGRSPDSADGLCLSVYAGSGRIEVPDMTGVEPMSRWANVEGRGFG